MSIPALAIISSARHSGQPSHKSTRPCPGSRRRHHERDDGCPGSGGSGLRFLEVLNSLYSKDPSMEARRGGKILWQPCRFQKVRCSAPTRSSRPSAGAGWARCIVRAIRVWDAMSRSRFPPSTSVNDFRREARAVAALNHPNICTLHDVGPNYLVMELVEGPTLGERIEQGADPAGGSARRSRGRSPMRWRPRTRKGSFIAI